MPTEYDRIDRQGVQYQTPPSNTVMICRYSEILPDSMSRSRRLKEMRLEHRLSQAELAIGKLSINSDGIEQGFSRVPVGFGRVLIGLEQEI